MKRYAIRLTETDIPFMAEADDGAWVKFDEAQVDQFKVGQAYENGIMRRVLHDRPGLMGADDFCKFMLWMEEERRRNPYP